MRSVKQIKREARYLFRLCVVNGVLDQTRARAVMETVLKSRRRGYLKLANQFERLVRLERQKHSAEVESATPLSPELRAAVETSFARMYGPGISTTFRESPALIGGMRIRVASDIYDGSIKGGLAALEKSFESLGA